MKFVGIILIVLGVLALVYQGIQYTTREKILDIGSIKVSADSKKNHPSASHCRRRCVGGGDRVDRLGPQKDIIGSSPSPLPTTKRGTPPLRLSPKNHLLL